MRSVLLSKIRPLTSAEVFTLSVAARCVKILSTKVIIRKAIFTVLVLLTATGTAQAQSLISGWEVVGRSCQAADGEAVHCDEKKLRQQILDDPHNTEPVQKATLSDLEPKDMLTQRRTSSLVNVYFFGRWVDTAMINLDRQHLQFETPSHLLDILTGVHRLEEVAEHLKKAMPLNTGLVCSPWREKRDCGWLEPKDVGVIYDAKRLRVDLFLANEFLSYRSRYSDLYLPEARPRKTSIVSARAVATRLDQENSGVYSTATGLFSYGEGNLAFNADYNSESDLYRIRTFSLTHYFPDHELQAGTFSYSPSGYLANLDVMGMRWNSSTKSRRNVAHLLSSDVEIFLPRRSIVQLAIGDRVYSGASYEAGSHNLDTSMLPEGTYELDVIINDPDSGTRVEKRLHTRSPLLPPAGQGKYGFMLGAPVDSAVTEKYPQREKDVVFAADYGQRLDGRTAWRLGFMQLRQDSLLQGQLIQFKRNTLWKARLLAGESHTYGLGFSVAYKNGWFSTKLDADHYNSDINFEASETKALQTLLASGFTQVIGSISRQIGVTAFELKSTYREQDSFSKQDKRNQVVLSMKRPVLKGSGIKGEFEARYQRDSVEEQVLLQLRLAFDKNRWKTKANVNYGVDKDGDSRRSKGVSATYKSADSSAQSYWKNTVFAIGNDRSDTVGAKLGFENRHFNAAATTELSLKESGESLHRSVGEVGVQIALDGDGTAAGGMAFTGSGVIIDVSGEPKGRGFDIFANGSRVRSGRIGSTHFVSLKPFKDYTLKLVPQSMDGNGIDRREHSFTLYPGNVERVRTHTVPQYRLITTLVDQTGGPLGEAVVERAGSTFSIEADGMIKMMVAPGEILSVKTMNQKDCLVVTPVVNSLDVLVSDRPLVCFVDPVVN